MKKTIKQLLWSFAALLLLQLNASGQTGGLNRGVAAIPSGENVFVSWRLLETDPEGTGFNVYRSNEVEDRTLLNEAPIILGTNFVDRTADLSKSNAYTVEAVYPEGSALRVAATEAVSAVAAVPDEPYYTVNLRNGNFIHFVWVGDLDGDGDFDFVVDRLGDGASVPDKIEAYTNDGVFLWEVNYGPNSLNRDNFNPGSSTIDVGHWDGVTVADVNGDGKAEVITKIANGVTFGDGEVWTHSDNRRQWICVLDGETGARMRYSSIPQDYISVGPMAAQLGVGNDSDIFVHLKNRNADGSFNTMDLCYIMGGSLTLKWKRTGLGPQGHQIRVVDVNEDGVDDLAHIGYVLDGNNGNVLYQLDGVVHGDRFQIGKFDPNRPGLQGYAIQQNNPSALVEYYYDASNGQILWRNIVGVYDNGRGNAADIDPRYPGYEMWSFNGIYNAPTQTQITNEPDRPWPNFRLWWDGDDGSELYDNGKIERWNYNTNSTERMLTTADYGGVGSWRGAPLFYGDIIGDWREEVVLKNSSNNQLVIFTTNIPTSISRPSLTTDRYYRNCLTTKGYMQSHYTSYYIGEGNNNPPPPPGNFIQLQNRGTGLFLDGLGRTTNGEACAQWSNTTHPNAQWEMIDVGQGYVQLKNRGTGLLLDGMGRTGNGDDCGQWANTTHHNSHWSVQQFDGNYYRIQNRATGLFLDGMGRTGNGDACGQYANTTHPNAQWELINVSARVASGVTEDRNVVIYPNPADNDITIETGLSTDTEVILTIQSVNGQVVYNRNLGHYAQGAFRHSISTEKFRSGLYILSIELADRKITKSIIVN